MQVETFNYRNEQAESKLLHFKAIPRGEFSSFSSFSHCVYWQGQRGGSSTADRWNREWHQVKRENPHLSKALCCQHRSWSCTLKGTKSLAQETARGFYARQFLGNRTKRSGKMRKEMLKSSLKLTGDKWNIVLSQIGKSHEICSSAEKRHWKYPKLKTNKLLFFLFLSFPLSHLFYVWDNSSHCTPQILFRLKALPHTETPIFQLIVNKCGSFYRCRSKSNTFTDTRRQRFSAQFLLPFFNPLLIVIRLTLPAECCAFLFSTCQDLEVNHLLFALFSQLNCSSQKDLSLHAKLCVWGEKHSCYISHGCWGGPRKDSTVKPSRNLQCRYL